MGLRIEIPFLLLCLPASLEALKGSGAEAGLRQPPQLRSRLYSFQKQTSGKPSELHCLDPSQELPTFSTLRFEASNPSEPWNFSNCPHPPWRSAGLMAHRDGEQETSVKFWCLNGEGEIMKDG